MYTGNAFNYTKMYSWDLVLQSLFFYSRNFFFQDYNLSQNRYENKTCEVIFSVA